jgi:hypothetical protein
MANPTALRTPREDDETRSDFSGASTPRSFIRAHAREKRWGKAAHPLEQPLETWRVAAFYAFALVPYFGPPLIVLAAIVISRAWLRSAPSRGAELRRHACLASAIAIITTLVAHLFI